MIRLWLLAHSIFEIYLKRKLTSHDVMRMNPVIVDTTDSRTEQEHIFEHKYLRNLNSVPYRVCIM